MENDKISIPYIIDIDDTPLIEQICDGGDMANICNQLLKDVFHELFDRKFNQQDIYSAIKHHYDRTNKS